MSRSHTARFAFVACAFLLMGLLLLLFLRYLDALRGGTAPARMTVTDTFAPPDGWTLPPLLVVEPGGVLVFRPGRVKVPERAEIRVKGKISWHTAALEKTSFVPLSDSVFSRLSITFSGSGRVACASFSGFTGPVGRPRLLLSLSAAGDLEVESCDFDGVSSPPGSPLMSAAKKLRIVRCRYDSDNRSSRAGRCLASADEVNVDGFELKRLTGFDELFRCSSLEAKNLSVLGAELDRLVRSAGKCDYYGLSLAAVSCPGPLELGGTASLRGCALHSAGELALAARSLSVQDSLLVARSLSLEASPLSVEGSALVASGGNLALGGGEGQGGLALSGDVSCRASLVALRPVERRLLDAFAAGTAELSGEANPSAFGACFFLLEPSRPLPSSLSFSGCFALCAPPPPPGVSLLPSDTDSLAAALKASAPPNEALASVIGKAAASPVFSLGSPSR